MGRLLYEQSVSHKGYLIIPFVFASADNYEIYSYKILSANNYKSKFHKAENPTGIYGSSIENIVEIAKDHLDTISEFRSVDNTQTDDFKTRYTYRNNLIIVAQEAGKYFYNHYPPDSLNNIAAPKLFQSEFECINWIKHGLDGLNVKQKIGKVKNVETFHGKSL
ncbi:MAG: hypothetical protein AAF378_09535 [Cyanobacteria bacterium P01_A01_bin.84]